MSEVEHNVRIQVNGPKEEIETYIHWLKSTKEYQLKSGFKQNIPASHLSLTDFSPLEEAWKFTSTDMVYQIKRFQRKRLKTLKYQVNYIVYYPSSLLETDQDSAFEVEEEKEVIFQELVHAFNPIPPILRLKCPNLNVGLTWNSYYLKSKYQVHSFESDHAIY